MDNINDTIAQVSSLHLAAAVVPAAAVDLVDIRAELLKVWHDEAPGERPLDEHDVVADARAERVDVELRVDQVVLARLARQRGHARHRLGEARVVLPQAAAAQGALQARQGDRRATLAHLLKDVVVKDAVVEQVVLCGRGLHLLNVEDRTTRRRLGREKKIAMQDRLAT